MVSLGNLPGFRRGGANAVSADGLVIAGLSIGGTTAEAFRWTSAEGMVGLGAFPGSSRLFTQAFAVSADGSVIVGNARMPRGTEAFRWTESRGMVALGDFPGGTFSSNARAVSGDGSIIVGSGRGESSLHAFLWDPVGGLQNLQELLSEDRTEEAGIAFGQDEACVTGETLDGTPIEGCDSILVVGSCGIGFELALLLPGLIWLHRRRRHGSPR